MDLLKTIAGVDTLYELAWVGLGFGAQALFMMRFLVQWLASERAGRSVMPIAFWYFSLGGGALLLAYAIHTGDRVFIAGQSGGLLIYTRNLYFIHRERFRDRTPVQDSKDASTTSTEDPTASASTESTPR